MIGLTEVFPSPGRIVQLGDLVEVACTCGEFSCGEEEFGRIDLIDYHPVTNDFMYRVNAHLYFADEIRLPANKP